MTDARRCQPVSPTVFTETETIIIMNKPPQGPKKPPVTPNGKPGGTGLRPGRPLIVFLMFSALAVTMLMYSEEKQQTITVSEFRRRVIDGQVEKVVISDEKLTGTMVAESNTGKPQGTSEEFQVTLNTVSGKQEDFSQFLREHNVEYSYERMSTLVQVLLSILPWILILGFMYFFVFRQMRGAGGMLGNFGRSRHQVGSTNQRRVTFEDVAGIEEAKEEVAEIIQFLRDPKKFQRLGGRIPRGVLLVGNPGCGKTLLAKAIAGEAEVPFFSISGSDFVEMFVGVGASRVRDLFKQAKENSPCIIFLDEIDAVGRKRGAGIAGGGHDEREQTLNAILVEMDGFSTNDQVIVIAATNRADVLDHALTRPGRFDRQIYVPLPDVKGRMEILKVHARKVKLSDNIDLHRLARGTPMFSGADLEAIINEAALSATMAEKESIEMDDLEEARDKVRWGRARRSREIDEKERIAVAYHEAGHALVQSLLDDADPVHKVSIIPRSAMGGATFSLPERDRTMYTRRYCLAFLQTCFGGRLAEEIFVGDISSGASGDISQATGLARTMITEWGMSEALGFVRYQADQTDNIFADMMAKEHSDQTAQVIDQEVKRLLDEAADAARKLIETHRDQMEAVKDALLKYETIDGEELKQIIAGKVLDKPTVADLLAAEQQRTDQTRSEENAAPAESPQGPADAEPDSTPPDNPAS